MSEVKRYYPAYSDARGVWMETVATERPTEDGHYYAAADYAALHAKAERLARLLRNFTIFDWREELKGSQFHPEDVDRIELDAMQAAEALAEWEAK